ncbi:hypothetical protein STRTUCAR8_01212 [Streptomyces turgidiscabies Car8]|uniref:Uncharacterized protein n=1 Tax=Streptomyces turgidiscabies (strain Car8) TaxID=698760 RepID=L7FF42_STRT8|nr:hypothetical protein STRTUCAR8_01212 [Streptomyces turgidiscabies Car8]
MPRSGTAPAGTARILGLHFSPRSKSTVLRRGRSRVDGGSGELTVRLREQDGTVLFTKVLQPGRVGQ